MAEEHCPVCNKWNTNGPNMRGFCATCGRFTGPSNENIKPQKKRKKKS